MSKCQSLNILGVFDESGTDVAECRMKMASGRKVAGVIRCLVKARGLQHDYAKVLYEELLVPVVSYGNETMIWREKDKFRIWVV